MSEMIKTPYDPMAAFYSVMRGARVDAPVLGSGYGNLDLGVPAEPAYTPPAEVASPFMPKGAAPGELGTGYYGIPLPGATGAGAAEPSSFWSMKAFLGDRDLNTGIQTPGWGGMALGVGQGLMNGFLGMKQYGLMKDQLAESRRQYDQNYAAQRQTTNTRLEDRQRARVASNAAAYQSVGDYMNQNGVK